MRNTLTRAILVLNPADANIFPAPILLRDYLDAVELARKI